MKHFTVLPQYLGPAENFVTKVIDGRMFAEVNSELVEVVSAGVKELSKIPYDLAEGLYVVGTGSSGATEALCIMGAAYFATMLASALAIKGPHPTYKAPAIVRAAGSTLPVTAPPVDITVDEAFRTPQFHLLGITFFCLATGGIGTSPVAVTAR